MFQLCENMKFYQVIEPDADAWVTGAGIKSRIVDMRNYRHCTFVMMCGANGGAAALTVTVEAVDTVAGTLFNAVPFWYSTGTTLVHGNVMSALTRQNTPATGMALTAALNADAVHIIEVDASDCLIVMDTAGREFMGVRLCVTESGGAVACDGAALAVLSQPRYAESPASMPAALLA